MKIGYQGMSGSNSEEAAKQLAKRLNIEKPEYIPLISSVNVITALKCKEIDYGVIASKNSITGLVMETFDAIKNEHLKLIATEVLPIHHCIFIKDTADKNKINLVASHIQALLQTKQNRNELLPNCEEKEVEDTALAAKWLSDGTLPDNVAVICSERIQSIYKNLVLMRSNVEDNFRNLTEFDMYALPDFDYDNKDRPSFWKRIKYQFINGTILRYLSKAIIVLSIFLSVYIANQLEINYWDTAKIAGSWCASIFLYITSDKVRRHSQYKSIKGYWKYFSLSDNDAEKEKQRMYLRRIVQIEEIDGELLLTGFICDKENLEMFESSHILISDLGKQQGQLVYWYNNFETLSKGYMISGIVTLKWLSTYPEGNVNRMFGQYYGYATKDSGSVEYLRISKTEFEAYRNNQFLQTVR